MKYHDWLQEMIREAEGHHVCVNCGATVTLDDVDTFMQQILIGEGYDALGNYYCSAECIAEAGERHGKAEQGGVI